MNRLMTKTGQPFEKGWLTCLPNSMPFATSAIPRERYLTWPYIRLRLVIKCLNIPEGWTWYQNCQQHAFNRHGRDSSRHSQRCQFIGTTRSSRSLFFYYLLFFSLKMSNRHAWTDPTRGVLKGTTEKEKTDRLRERRKKKSTQRVRHKERERTEKAVDKANPGLGNVHAKTRVLRNLQKAEKEGTVSLVGFSFYWQIYTACRKQNGISTLKTRSLSYRSRRIERKLRNRRQLSSNNCKKTSQLPWTRLDKASRNQVWKTNAPLVLSSNFKKQTRET